MNTNLILVLEKTNLIWTLPAHSTRTVGHNSNCDIILPSIGHLPTFNLEFRYDQSIKKWYVKNLDDNKNVTINNELMEQKAIPISGETRIEIKEGQALLARPKTQSKETGNFQPFSQNSATNLVTSTRLLSGYAYLKGIFSSFELLDYLRVEPYKAKIPASNLDMDEIAGHAARSALITLLFAILALATVSVQILVIIETGSVFSIFSRSGSVAGIMGGLLIGFELVYLRWFMSRQFIKKNYKLNYHLSFLKFLEPLVNHFRKLVIQDEQTQNVIVFGGNYPFTGYGELIPKSNWTLPIDRKAKTSESNDSNSKVDIPVYEFYKSVDAEIHQKQLPKLKKFSRLFIDGFELEDGQFLTDPTSQPGVTYLEDPLLNEEHSKLGSIKRAYRVYQYTDTERDYVLTHFLRFSNIGSITFIESAAYILAGIDRKRFSLISTLLDTHFSRLIKALIMGLLLGIFGVAGLMASVYIGLFLYKIISWQFNNFQQKRSAELQEEYNYGVDKTLREYIAEPLSFQRKENLKEKVSTLTIKKIIFNPLFFLNPIGIFIIFNAIWLWVLFWIPLSFAILVNTDLKALLKVDREIKVNFDYYGTQDTLLYWKTIQTTIFHSTIKTLKEKGVDTLEFENFQQIINNGLMIDANTITNNGQMFGGVDTQATFNQTVVNRSSN
ncbi:MAG: hypothetical protein O4751_07190 [Trichodesmium sp. St2_bin6]|nr:hypothetical protein [Trichodesmium sp. St2_bin6]